MDELQKLKHERVALIGYWAQSIGGFLPLADMNNIDHVEQMIFKAKQLQGNCFGLSVLLQLEEDMK